MMLKKVFWPWVGLMLMLLAATPQQAAGLDIPWWVWLVVIAVLLLLLLIVILRMDWGTAGKNDKNE
jgi:hypothetical protein